jgi:hypothetical protein
LIVHLPTDTGAPPRPSPAHFRNGWHSQGMHLQVIQYLPGGTVYLQNATDVDSFCVAIPPQLVAMVAESLAVAARLLLQPAPA